MTTHQRHSAPLELWGGIECTVNRVGDQYFDQIATSKHAERLDDLDRIAALGIQRLRYPVLWERVEADGRGGSDWSWTDVRLHRLRTLGVAPIAGLLHHGSGPRNTNLLDPEFPGKLAAYARRVAERYPWLTYYTPVNEPLTTARFSTLYGHWYPHAHDARSFLTALIHQCKGISLAMEAIRAVTPQAKLVQTEDLGKVYGTPTLQYQVDFENHRRWLSLDLLAGKVDWYHPLWSYLQFVGIPEQDVLWFRDHPCPPDVLGLNYYVTGERFLDERIQHYPSEQQGGNGRHVYVDTEAVRVRTEGITGLGALLREAWDRYGLTLAVTEVHLGCTREEQLRWFLEAWDQVQQQRAAGVPVTAITAWSLLGAFDWNCLLTKAGGCYEPGVFDLRGGSPRPTILAKTLQQLARGERPDHPVLDSPGWWRRPERLNVEPWPERPAPATQVPRRRRPLLITGGTGTLGRAFARICQHRGIEHRVLTRKEMDIADSNSVRYVLDGLQPWAVINAAGYVRVDDAEDQREACLRENVEGPTTLAAACADRTLPFLTFSSDLVFDGRQTSPYHETDAVAPLGVYGHSKAEAERRVQAILPQSLIVRTSAFYGPWDEYNFVIAVLRHLAAGRPFTAADDLIVSPTYVPQLVHTCLDLLVDGAEGLWHLAHPTEVTWADFARRAAQAAHLDTNLIMDKPAKELGLRAPRPTYSVLGSQHGQLLPCLEEGIDRYVRECEVNWQSTC